MIIRKEIINKLNEFGLNSYEGKLWTALLSRGVSTAGELSDISNVPRSRAYDVLESLEKKGFIIVKLGKPIKYLAVTPKEVVERVKKRVQNEADMRSKALDNLKDSELLKELNSLHNTGIEKIDPTDRSGSFRGRTKLYDHLSAMIKRAEKSITIVTTTAGFSRKTSKFYNDLQKAVKKGVKIRVAAPLGDLSLKKAAKDFNGVEVRKTDIASRFCSIDGTELLLMLMDDGEVHENFDCGVWVTAPYFVRNFERMFEHEWNRMKIV